MTGTAKENKAESQIVSFLGLLHEPGDVFELRVFDCPQYKGRSYKRTASGYFTDIDAAARQAMVYDALEPPGVFVTLNPVDPELLARSHNRITWNAEKTTTDGQIVCRRCFVVDIDPVRASGISSTDVEMMAAVNLAHEVAYELSREGWPAPLIGMSGNGAYALFQVDLPNNDDATALIKDVLGYLHQRFSTAAAVIDTSTYNASRIIKLFGTTARKGDNFQGTEELPARPHRLATFEPPESELTPVPRELLKSCRSSKPPSENAPCDQPLSARENTSAIRRRWESYVAKIPDAIAGEKGSNPTFHAASECFRFGMSESEAWDAMQWFNAQKCQPPWNDKELHHKLEDARKCVNEKSEFGCRLRERDVNQRVAVTAPVAVKLPRIESPNGRTDAANAARLRLVHGNDLHWCEPQDKWYVFDGRRWCIDLVCEIDVRAKQVGILLWQQAEELGERLARMEQMPKDTGKSEGLESLRRLVKEVRAFAKVSNSANGIKHFVELTRSEPGIPILPEVWERDPWLMNVANGTLDLRNGQLRPHAREDFLTKLCSIAYNPDAKAPIWEDFLNGVFAGNRRMIDFIQRAVGYSLTAVTYERCLFFCYGTGKNGKSTFARTLQNCLGDYAGQITTDLIMTAKGERHPTETCDLAGKRLVVASETEDGRRFAESFIKQMTGGEDKLKGRRMREDMWEFNATHKLWISGNHKPRIRGTDDGIWDRVRLIPFNVRFHKPDKVLPAKLAAELPGILAWCVRGCLEWQRVGLLEPDEVREATSAYRVESDVVGQFLDECCFHEVGHEVSSQAMYDRFSGWSDMPMQRKAFGGALLEKGIEDGRFTAGQHKGKKCWKGIGLIGEAE